MPIFKVIPKEEKKAAKKAGIPQEVIDEYKGYIEQLDNKTVGILEFKKDENIALGRKALQQAGEESKKYVKVRRPRGEANVLQVERITRKEWVEAKKMAKARGAKLKKTAEPKAQPKPKAKAKRKKK
jgi:hypothetical protein